MQILNIGCGSKADHYLRPEGESLNTDILITEFNRGLIDLQCDGRKLPFNDNVFNKTVCFHTLEHVETPLEILREIQRVTSGEVIIRVPSLHGASHVEKEDEGHIYTWTKSSFENFLHRVFDEVKVHRSSRIHTLVKVFPFMRKTIEYLFSYFIKDELTAWCKC